VVEGSAAGGGGVGGERRAQMVEGAIAAFWEAPPPIAERLLVEVVLAALAGYGGGEQHVGSVGGQRIDELCGLGGGQVLGDLEALHQIELSAQIDRCREIGIMKVARV